MYKVKVFVTLRESVLDPAGNATKATLEKIGYDKVNSCRVGKYLELMIDKSVENIDETVQEMCEKLLVNMVMEDYRYEIEESVSE